MRIKIVTGNKSVLMSILGVVLCCSFFAFFTIAFCSTDKYMILCLLPLVFGLFSLFFCECYSLIGKSITITLLVAILFLKNIIMPLIMSFCTTATISSVNTEPKLTYAVFLLIYEQLAVFGTIYYNIPRMKKWIFNKPIKEYAISKVHLKWFIRIVVLLALIIIVLLVAYPLLSVFYRIGVSGDTNTNIELARRRILMSEAVPMIPRYMFAVFAELLRWMVPIVVTLKLYLSKLKNWLKVILSMGIAVCVALIVSDTVATSLFIVISIFFLVYRLYKGNGSGLVIISSVGVVIFAVMALFIKSFGSGVETFKIDEIAGVLQAYFSGPDNVAITAMIDEPVTISQIFGDVFGFIPFVMHFFKNLPNTRILFNTVFWGTTGIETQIIPMISQGARYFTPILAPIFTILVVQCSLVWEKRVYEKRELLHCVILIIACVCFSMGVGMYSASLIMQQFFAYIFPLFFLYRFISTFFRQ